MNLEIQPVKWEDISHWFIDFQKKSKCYELIPDCAELIGLFKDSKLIGYLATIYYTDKTVWIFHGYLSKEARHLNLGPQYLKLLEDLCKLKGFKKIMFKASRSMNSYLKFAFQCGYKPIETIFAKEVI